VHISFVRSTNLDSWQLNQLRTMKVGGNASATEFFSKHGGSSLLSDSDTKKKYSGKVAELYKEELASRVKADAVRFPTGIVVEGMETVSAAVKDEPEDDFFTSWSKPDTPKSSNPSTPRVSSNPGAPRAPNQGTPRVLTTGAASVNSKKSKRGLGASKAKPVNFAEAERKARDEEERLKQLGYDREREEAEAKSKKEAENLRLAQDLQSKVSINSPGLENANKVATSTSDTQKSLAFPRLGFGAIPGAGAAAAVAASSATPSRKEASIADEAPTTARQKFGNQKAISSDMFFGRGDYNADQVREAQTRLQAFQGATSISSNQYFGRDEDDTSREDGEGGLLGDGSLSGLESAAKDAIAKVLANPDVQNIGESIRTGALKFSDYLATISER